MKAVYAGSFDPITNGHLHVLVKAAKMFDHVYLMIADNPNKKTMFSLEERKKLAEEACKSSRELSFLDSYVEVVVCERGYVVNECVRLEAGFMIRGIRNVNDFQYETDIYFHNKSINPNVETVYIMPDCNISACSSSAVKALANVSGWTNVVNKYVPPVVYSAFTKKYIERVHSSLVSILSTPTAKTLRLYGDFNSICDIYEKRAYHNLDHVAFCLDRAEELKREFIMPRYIVQAALMLHDIDKNVKETEEKIKYDDSTCRDILRLIMATDHVRNNEELEMIDEKLVHDIDLSVLALPDDLYDEYVKKVRREYQCTDEEWKKGRSDFLKKMLNSGIFTTVFFDYRRARDNMRRELNSLGFTA
jgi:pantetheine-phosphate adenylyltransferase